jgi:hypothetical protein
MKVRKVILIVLMLTAVLMQGGVKAASAVTAPNSDVNWYWHLRNSNSAGSANLEFPYGRTHNLPIVGDWNGDGSDTVGVFRSETRTWYLRNSNTSGYADWEFPYGRPGYVPVVGDWNGDGVDTVGVFYSAGRIWYLRNSNTSGNANLEFAYGGPGYTPIVGDWNGDGVDTVGVFHNESKTWYLKNSNTSGNADLEFQYGQPGDIPVVGDWNGDGIDTVGVFRSTNRTWYLKNSNTGGTADQTFQYGRSSDTPVVGDWNKDGVDTVGIVRAGTASTDLITNLQVSSGKPYTIGNCGLGSRYYIDRDYTITGFTKSSYDGLTCIKSSNEDDDDSSSNLIEFDLNVPARIYIYWDSRAGEAGRPGWMEGLYPINGKKVYVTDGDMGYFNVLSCDSTPGHIVLGGPHSDGGSGSKSMYVVAVRPIDDGERLCSAPGQSSTPYHATTNFRASVENGTTTIWLQVCGRGAYHRFRSKITEPYAEILGDWTKGSVNGCSPEYRAVIQSVPGEQFRFYSTVMDHPLSETSFLQQAQVDSCTVLSPGYIECKSGYVPPSPPPPISPPSEKILPVRYVDQVFVEKHYDGFWNYCGPASLAMFLHYQSKIEEDVFIDRSPTITIAKKVLSSYPTGGTVWVLSEALLEEEGFDAHVSQDPSFDDLKDSIDRGYPVVMGWSKSTGGHQVLVVGYRDPNTVIIHDPMGGKLWGSYPDPQRNDVPWQSDGFNTPRSKGRNIEYEYDSEITGNHWLKILGDNSSVGNSVAIITSEGGTLSGDRIRVAVPANTQYAQTLSSPSVVLTYTSRTLATHTHANLGIPVRLFELSGAMETDGTAVTQLDRDFTITLESASIDYWDSSGSIVPNIELAYWDEAGRIWVTLPSTLDLNNHTISVQTDHLSDFILYAKVYRQLYLPMMLR